MEDDEYDAWESERRQKSALMLSSYFVSSEIRNVLVLTAALVFFDIPWWIVAIIVGLYLPAIIIGRLGIRTLASTWLAPLLVLCLTELVAYAIFAILLLYAFAFGETTLGAGTPSLIVSILEWYHSQPIVKKIFAWVLIIIYFQHYTRRFSVVFRAAKKQYE